MWNSLPGTGRTSTTMPQFTHLLVTRLRVPELIQFRLAVQVYRCRHNAAPLYLANDLHWTDESEELQRLRSGARLRLIVPRTRLRTVGDRAFGVAAACMCRPLSLQPAHSRLSKDNWKSSFSTTHFLSLAYVLEAFSLNATLISTFNNNNNKRWQLKLPAPVWGRGTPLFSPCLFTSSSFPLLLFSFFHWLYLFSSFVHPFPFYQNSPTPFPGRRS